MLKYLDIRSHKAQMWLFIMSLPYLVLLLLNAANLLLRDEGKVTYDSFSIASTVLERDIWIFPSPILHWVDYAIFFFFFYIVPGILTLVVKKCRQKRVETVVPAEDRSSVCEIISPFLKLMMLLSVIVIIVEVHAGAARSHGLVGLFGELLYALESILPVILGVSSVMFFFWEFFGI